MAGTGKALIVPTKEELALLNRRLIEEYGGGFHNGRSISVHLDTVDVALRIATGQMTISELATWYSEQQ